MRRLITIFFLTAALFVLMGCGTGSKDAPQPSVEKKIFTLPLGEYIGTEGNERYADNVDLDKIKGLYDLRAQHRAAKNALDKYMAEQFMPLFEKSKAHEALADDARANDHDQLAEEMKSQLKDMRAKAIEMDDAKSALADQLKDSTVVEREYAVVNFSIAHNEETGLYELHNFSLEYIENDEDKIEKPLGDVINISFNKETGEVSFSEMIDDHYSVKFNGQLSEEMIFDEKRIVLSGMGSSSKRNDAGEETINHFSLRALYYPPVKEEVTADKAEQADTSVGALRKLEADERARERKKGQNNADTSPGAKRKWEAEQERRERKKNDTSVGALRKLEADERARERKKRQNNADTSPGAKRKMEAEQEKREREQNDTSVGKLRKMEAEQEKREREQNDTSVGKLRKMEADAEKSSGDSAPVAPKSGNKKSLLEDLLDSLMKQGKDLVERLRGLGNY